MTKLLKALLDGFLSKNEIDQVAGGFDLIGDIAILKLPPSFDQQKKRLIGNMLISKVPRIKSVWNQLGPVDGRYRLRRLEHIAGEERTKTEYREHGIRLIVDVANAYFSPRLSTERLRVCKKVKEGEVIMNMFSGVGSFSILIAKKVNDVKIYSSEINEYAFNLMLENIRLNKVSEKVFPLLGDCVEHMERLKIKFDRIIMSLPEEAYLYLPRAFEFIREGGTIHYYSMVKGEKKDVVKDELQRVKLVNDRVELEEGRIVTEAGPRIYEVVLDLISK